MNTLYKDIIAFLSPLPCMQNERRRRGLLVMAALDDRLPHIDVAGAPQECAAEMVEQLRRYGTVGDQPALVLLLQEVAAQVGDNQQAAIADLCERVRNAPPDTPPDPGSDPEDAPLREAYLSYLFERCNQVVLRGIDRKATQHDAACLNLSAIYTALLTRGGEAVVASFS